MCLRYLITPWTVFLLVETKTDKNSSVTSFALEDNKLVFAIFNFSRIDLVEDNSINFSITFLLESILLLK